MNMLSSVLIALGYSNIGKSTAEADFGQEQTAGNCPSYSIETPMYQMMSRLLLSALFVLVSSFTYAKGAVKVPVGDEMLVLPVPSGFIDPKEAAPVLHSRAEHLTPPNMRLLSVYVAESDMSAASAGTAPKFDSYFMAQVLRSKETGALNLKDFESVKSQVRGAPRVEEQKQVLAEVQRHVSSVARTIGNESGQPQLALNIGETRQLGVFDETDRSLSLLVVTAVDASTGERKLAATMAQATSFVLLRGKVVLFTAYKKIESDADYSWLREQCEAWVRAAVKENSK